jgi:hypothetical protein
MGEGAGHGLVSQDLLVGGCWRDLGLLSEVMELFEVG